VTKQTAAAHGSGCTCKACITRERNRFFKGKVMKAAEFEMEQRYGIERRRMLSRAIAGWGVVRGLALKGSRPRHATPPEPCESLCISPGLALDRYGREIILPTESVLGSDNTFVAGVGCELASVDKLQPGDYVLAIHYAERLLGEVLLPGDCCGCRTEQNYVCETALFSLRRLSRCEECPCGERPCPPECECGRHGCECEGRARNSCLCEWTAKTEPPGCSAKPCRWRGYDVYADDGVDLACIRVCEPTECDKPLPCRPILGWIVDDCAPRRIVKGNDLLYDLIRGCDLTRIKCLSWGKWHRRAEHVPWDEFIHKIHGEITEHHDLKTGLALQFTGPVLEKTVRTDCFSIRFSVPGEWPGWRSAMFVPITRVEKPHHPGDPPETTRQVTLCVRPDWYEELTSHASRVRREGATVRIEVNGDYILDCHGQPIDANARGFALREEEDCPVQPSGNGTPGGVLVSQFRVARGEQPAQREQRPVVNFQEE